MQSKRRKMGVLGTAMAATALAMFLLTSSASAKLVGEYEKFQFCDWKNVETHRCIHSVTEGGSVKLGSKTVPIVNPAVLQGGYKKPIERISDFIGATNGITLSKAPQPVPGGLAGLVNCPEISNFFLRIACEATFENGLTGLNSTLEIAGSPSNIKISELNLSQKLGVALKMPVKIRLENPFLGSNCYVGSDKAPMVWELTTGKTADEKFVGTSGKIQFLEGGRILRLSESSLVDNDWPAPEADGCGGIFSFLLDPIVSSAAGLPAAAGVNVANLKTTSNITAPATLKKIDEENP
jgi:hypothetical protein